ncbi:MAG: hypothetical protein KDA33_11435 [Phycisphaerales bacterium]|nr:hypothetical protein [Phycisphaerales bacterium]
MSGEFTIPDGSRCIDCGYALRGLRDNACPECGRTFDATDESTFETDDGARSWRRWAQAPSLWSIVPWVALTLFALNDASKPGTYWYNDLVYLFGVVLGLIVAMRYWRRVCACRNDAARAAMDKGPRRRRRAWRWVVFPACLALMVSLGIHNWPLSLRFALSRSAMDAMQTRIDGGAPIPKGTIIVGLYRVWIRRVYGRTIYFTGGSHPSSGSGKGFIQGVATHPGVRSHGRLVGRWYIASGYPYERATSTPTTAKGATRGAGG